MYVGLVSRLRSNFSVIFYKLNETEAVLSTDWPKKIVIENALWLMNSNQNRTEQPTQMYSVSSEILKKKPN